MKKIVLGFILEKTIFAWLIFFGCISNCVFSLDYILYGTVGNQATGHSDLVIIDPVTGLVDELIGSIGYIVNGLAFDPTTKTMYATTSNGDVNFPKGLITIDLLTGAGTPIGSGFGGASSAIVCLTCDDSGQLWAWIESRPFVEDDLVKVFKDGTYFQLSDAGIWTAATGLDFYSNGTLYLFNGIHGFHRPDDRKIFTLNLTTGQPTFTGYSTNVPTGEGFLHHGKFNPETWDFWGIDSLDNLRSIAIVDVNGVYQGSIGTVDNLHTLAFVLLEDPIFVMGKQEKNEFFSETEYFNKIKWKHEPQDVVVAYFVYRNGVLIEKVSESINYYIDHNQKKGKRIEYSVQALYSDGSLSPLASTFVN